MSEAPPASFFVLHQSSAGPSPIEGRQESKELSQNPPLPGAHHLDVESISQGLLQHGLLLTAVELYTELSEEAKAIPTVLSEFVASVASRAGTLGPPQPSPEVTALTAKVAALEAEVVHLTVNNKNAPTNASSHTQKPTRSAAAEGSINTAVLRYLHDRNFQSSASAFAAEANVTATPSAQLTQHTSHEELEELLNKEPDQSDTEDAAITKDELRNLREENRHLQEKVDALIMAAKHEGKITRTSSSHKNKSIEQELSALHERVITLEQRERAVIGVISSSLPSILCALPVGKREVLLPDLLVCAQHHTDAVIRTSHARAVLSIFKRPTDEQRASLTEVIQAACVQDPAGASRLEFDFRPEILAMSAHKYAERRAVSVAVAGTLAAFTKADSHHSMLVNLVVPLARDISPLVRLEVVGAFARLLDSATTAPLHESVVTNTIRLLLDSDDAVARHALNSLFPAVASWASTQQVMRSALLPALLAALEGLLEQSEGRTSSRCLTHALDVCLSKLPDAAAVNRPDLEAWMGGSFVPRLVKMITTAEAISYNESEILPALSSLFVSATQHLGESFGVRVSAPLLRRIVMDNTNRSSRCRALLPYLQHELCRPNGKSVVAELFVDVFTGAKSWDNVGRTAFFQAIARIPFGPALRDFLGILFEMALHPMSYVRCGVAVALHTVVSAVGCDEETCSSRVLPIVLTLASDTDPGVRTEATTTIGTTLAHVAAVEWVDKLGEALFANLLADGPDSTVGRAVLRVWAQVSIDCPTRFREINIVPHLASVVTRIASADKESKPESIMLLLDVFKSFSLCATFDDGSLVGSVILPAMRGLQREVDSLVDPHVKGLYSGLLKDISSSVVSQEKGGGHGERGGGGGMMSLLDKIRSEFNK